MGVTVRKRSYYKVVIIVPGQKQLSCCTLILLNGNACCRQINIVLKTSKTKYTTTRKKDDTAQQEEVGVDDWNPVMKFKENVSVQAQETEKTPEWLSSFFSTHFHWTSNTSLCKYPKMNVSPSHRLYFKFFFLKGKPLGLQTSKSYLLSWHHCYTITVELKQSEQVKAFLHSTPSLTLGTYSPLPQHHTNSPVYFDSNGVSGQPDGSASKAQQCQPDKESAVTRACGGRRCPDTGTNWRNYGYPASAHRGTCSISCSFLFSSLPHTHMLNLKNGETKACSTQYLSFDLHKSLCI